MLKSGALLVSFLLLAFSTGLPPLVPGAARADAPSRPDLDSGWQSGFQAPGMDGTVQAFCEYRGDLIAGGTFRTIGTQVIEHIARWDGTAWHALGAGLTGAVDRLAVRGDRLIAAGEFTAAGDAPAAYIASWDGTDWQPLGKGVDGVPTSLAVYRDTLFVGGRFRHAGDLTVKGIARWDGETWHDGLTTEDWWPCLAVTNLATAGGRLVATFQECQPDPEGVPVPWAPHPVLWNGAGWEALSGSSFVWPERLAVLGDTLYAAGYLYHSEGTSGFYVVRWTGTDWLPLGREWPNDPGVLAGHGGALYLARAGTLRRWTGQEWTVVSQPESANFDLLFSGRDGLYSGGARVVDGPGTAHGLARWDGAAWWSVGDPSGSGLNLWDEPKRVVLAPLGDGFAAAGSFLRIGDYQVRGVAEWNGFSWRALPPCPRPIRANAFANVGGRLTAVADDLLGEGSWIRTFDGTQWNDLVPFPGPVLAISPWKDRLAAGGSFEPGHILSAPQTLRNPDYRLLPLGPGLNNVVRATCRLEGNVVASGDFTATADGSVPLSHVGLWDGAVWQSLGDGLPATALTLEPFAGGVVAGMDDGVLWWDGAAWSRLGEVFDGPVQALAVFEGELVAGGAFTQAGSSTLGSLARWRDGRWQPIGAGMNGPVEDLLALGEDLCSGGAFTAAGGVPSSGIAVWREPRTGVQSLRAVTERDSVTLSWRDPASDSHHSTVARWSPHGFPADPADGLPLPFGEAGRFPASPGSVHRFSFTLPFDGGSAFYSVFAVHDDDRLSPPARVQVRMPDRIPPSITLEIRSSPEGAGQVAIRLSCSETLLARDVNAWLDSTKVRLVQEDDAGLLWTGNADLPTAGSHLFTVCARDSMDNEACLERGIAAVVAQPGAAGRCLAVGGRLLVEWSAGAFPSESPVTVIDGAPNPPTFEVAAPHTPLIPLVLSFQVPPDDSWRREPRRLGVAGPDGTVQGGAYDPASGRLVIRAATLGFYQLQLTDDGRSRLADPSYLLIAPAVPNPFRADTAFRVELRARQWLRVSVFDVLGREVASLYDGLAGPGSETFRWDGRAAPPGRALPSGVYFARVQTDRTAGTTRLVKIR